MADKIEFRVADALDLPFQDDLFDAILSESVATFIEEKQKAVSEYVRVVKPGGYVGLNEEVWLKTPPPGMSEAARHLWEIRTEIPTADDWSGILKSAGLRDLFVKANKVSPRREASQLKRYRLEDMWGMFRNSLSLYFKSAAFREYMKERQRLPRNLFQYLGYAVMAGRKKRAIRSTSRTMTTQTGKSQGKQQSPLRRRPASQDGSSSYDHIHLAGRRAYSVLRVQYSPTGH